MTDIYALWDHKCPELEELHKRGEVRFQGWACWCSSMERHYQIFHKSTNEWVDIDNCPFCNKSMTGYPQVGNMLNSTVMVFLDKECNECQKAIQANYNFCPWCGVKNG